MNRGQLVDAVSKNMNLPRRQADAVLSSVIETIQAGVKKDGEVRLVGFGTFKRATRKARTGRNPQTGEAIQIQKRVYPKFVASKTWDPTKALAAATKAPVKRAVAKKAPAKKAPAKNTSVKAAVIKKVAKKTTTRKKAATRTMI